MIRKTHLNSIMLQIAIYNFYEAGGGKEWKRIQHIQTPPFELPQRNRGRQQETFGVAAYMNVGFIDTVKVLKLFLI
jgi:hypothetical protein